MIQNLGFVLKVFALAGGLAIAIKWGAPNLHLSPTPTLSLAIVITPAVVVGLVLCWRAWRP